MSVEMRGEAFLPLAPQQIGLVGLKVEFKAASTTGIFRDYVGIFRPWTTDAAWQELQVEAVGTPHQVPLKFGRSGPRLQLGTPFFPKCFHYWEAVRSQTMGVEARKNMSKQNALWYGGNWRVSVFVCPQIGKKKIEGGVEHPTQSFPNKKDEFTLTIYSKEIKAGSCCSSNQKREVRQTRKFHSHFIQHYSKYSKQIFWGQKRTIPQ